MPYKSKDISFCLKDDLTDFIEKEIKSEIISRNFPVSHEIFRPGSITECERRIVYRANGVTEVDRQYTQSLPEYYSQKHLKNKWVDALKELKKFNYVDRDLEVVDNNYNLVSRVDAVFKMGNLFVIFMIKGLNQDEFNNVCDKGPKRSELVETMVNMWLAEVSNGIILYENTINNEFITYHIVPYEPIIMAVKKKCLNMMSLKILGKIPDRPYESSSSKECMSCEFQTACWK
jgi:hypothetical protein